MRNRSGLIHYPHIILPTLALIGCWFLYKSYTNNRLGQDLNEMIGDASSLASKVVSSPQDRALIDQKFSEIRAITEKYKINKSASGSGIIWK